MSKPLHFHPRWIDPILSGEKRVTVRPAGSGYRRGDVVKAIRRNRPAFAELRIERVQTLPLEAVSPRQAKLEGHQDVDAFKQALGRLYPEHVEFDVITFRLA